MEHSNWVLNKEWNRKQILEQVENLKKTDPVKFNKFLEEHIDDLREIGFK